jgi:hypothetical protein
MRGGGLVQDPFPATYPRYEWGDLQAPRVVSILGCKVMDVNGIYLISAQTSEKPRQRGLIATTGGEF